jgi:hypothetical protein
MPIPVTDLIDTTTPSDTYATHNSTRGKGGLHEVVDIAARDAITTERRTAGMLAYVLADNRYYTLGADLLTWSPLGTSVAPASTLTLGAGENLVVGDPVHVLANQFFIADNVISFRAVGVITVSATLGLQATATISGQVTLSGLTANAPYFLGAGIITSTAPATGYVVRLGQAVSATNLILTIEEPILLT